MPLFELADASINEIERTTFEELRIHERYDLQRLLRRSIHVIDQNIYVIEEEFGDWEDARRRIDLLCLDRDKKLVVVELKRTDDGGHMELQALRYAAMVSTMTFENAVEVHGEYLRRSGDTTDPRRAILQFLGITEDATQELALSSDVRIILASADFSRELTTTVLWLNERELDIRCVRLRPYRWQERVLLDVQQVLPLPEAGDYQVKMREKAVEKRAAEKKFNPDFSKYNVTVGDTVYPDLWKRALGFRILHTALASGINPEELAQHLGRSVPTWLISVEGTHDSARFANLASEISTKFGKYDLGRFFCDDENLLHLNGKTLAVSNQWSIIDIPAFQTIADSYSQLRLSFAKAVADIG
jgi:hypothetical protein